MGIRGQKESAEVRRHEALKLRMAGYTYELISQQLGVSVKTAHQDIRRVLRNRAKETSKDADALLELELARIDELLLTYWPKAKIGDAESARIVLSALKRRVDLLGLEAPKKLADPNGDPLMSGLTTYMDLVVKAEQYRASNGHSTGSLHLN